MASRANCNKLPEGNGKSENHMDGSLKWMFLLEHPIQINDLGVPLFLGSLQMVDLCAGKMIIEN